MFLLIKQLLINNSSLNSTAIKLTYKKTITGIKKCSIRTQIIKIEDESRYFFLSSEYIR